MVFLGQLGEFDKAARHLEKALALKPEDPMPHNNLAMIFAQQGKLDLAVEHFERALAINPKLYQAHHSVMLSEPPKAL